MRLDLSTVGKNLLRIETVMCTYIKNALETNKESERLTIYVTRY